MKTLVLVKTVTSKFLTDTSALSMIFVMPFLPLAIAPVAAPFDQVLRQAVISRFDFSPDSAVFFS